MPANFKLLVTSPLGPLTVGLLLLAFGWVWNWNSPLQGTHTVRQADTLFAAWSYCHEGAEFLRPRIAHRQLTSGISIGEFPLVSGIYAIPCKISGQWNEGSIKVVTLLFLAMNVLFWGLFIRRRWPSIWPGWEWFALVWLFATHQLNHLNIALPDTFALTLIAMAGFLTSSSNQGARRHFERVAAGLIFTLAFALRPYFIPLLVLVSPGWMFGILTFGACGIFYLIWFKGWIQQSEISYYATGLTPAAEAWALKGSIARVLFEEIFLRNLLNYVGLIWLWLGLRNTVWNDRRLLLSVSFSIAVVLALRAPMLISHHYYLNAAIMGLLIYILAGVRRAPPWIAWIFVFVAVINSQHHWLRQGERKLKELHLEMDRVGFQAGDKVAVYLGQGSANSPSLYMMKTTGWTFEGHQDPGGSKCPQGAVWKLHSPEGQQKLTRCE